MARIFDVVEYPDEMRNELVHKFPETGSGDFRVGTQVIVRESQAAVFFRDGQALDTFQAGRHTITTANIPYIVDLIGKAFNDRTPFTAEVYFVSIREFPDQKWGTADPIPVQTPGVGVGWSVLTGFGTYGFNISNPQQFVSQIVGQQGRFSTADIQERLRSVLISKFADLLGEQAVALSANFMARLSSLRDEFAAGARAKAQDDFKAIGLTLKNFYIQGLSPAQNAMEILRDRGLISAEGVGLYTQLQAADAMRDAANNPSGGAGLTAGIGAGMGIGNLMGQALQGGMQQPAQQPAQPAQAAGAGAAAGAASQRMSVAEAAEYLKVAEEDVVAAVNEGQLKAKKIGKSFNFTKKDLDDFLNA
ncbi:MAG: SPFH domain-containing protein [Chloroflexi bacterium]|nr:SPFH domain-containing protein [Chloroflexota bacterium]